MLAFLGGYRRVVDAGSNLVEVKLLASLFHVMESSMGSMYDFSFYNELIWHVSISNSAGFHTTNYS